MRSAAGKPEPGGLRGDVRAQAGRVQEHAGRDDPHRADEVLYTRVVDVHSEEQPVADQPFVARLDGVVDRGLERLHIGDLGHQLEAACNRVERPHHRPNRCRVRLVHQAEERPGLGVLHANDLDRGVPEQCRVERQEL